MPQASPDLAIALSREYRFGEELANFHHQILIGVHLRATLLWLPQPLLPLASGIEAGSRQLPDRGHSRHTIRLHLTHQGFTTSWFLTRAANRSVIRFS